MLFTISKESLSKSLAIVCKSINTKSAIAALGGVHVIASDGRVTFEATNLTTSVRHTVAASVEEPGETVVSGTVLPKLVKTLPDAPVTIEDSGTSVVLRCQRSRTRLNTLDPKDFPEFPVVSPDESVELPCDVLGELVKMAAKVVSKDDSRPVLKGIKLDVENDRLRLVATDSYRLVVCEAQLPAEGVAFSAVIPGNVLSEVAGTATGELSIGTTLNQVSMSFGDTTFVTRRIEGSFPNYRQLLPKSCDVVTTVDSDDLMASIRRASVVATDNPSVRIDVAPESLVITAVSQLDGEVTDEVAADSTGTMAIALNAKYLTDCVSAIDGEVVIELTKPTAPAVFKSYGEVDYLCLLMPVRM